MAGVDLRLLGELGEPLQGCVEVRGALARIDREVGPRGVADEERVAGQQVALDEVAAVLGPVPRGVQRLDED